MQNPGYYSWVCFIDVQRGAWAGPIGYYEIEQYEYGFALDENIKSWTEFTYYDKKPTDSYSCNFSKKTRHPRSAEAKTTTYSQCVANGESTIPTMTVTSENPSECTIAPSDQTAKQLTPEAESTCSSSLSVVSKTFCSKWEHAPTLKHPTREVRACCTIGLNGNKCWTEKRIP